VDDVPSNSQIPYRQSLDSVKSESGPSVNSDSDNEEYDALANSFEMAQLDTLINERVLLSQKKLFKGIEPPSRKISICDEDSFPKNNLPVVARRRKSTFIKHESFGRASLDSNEAVVVRTSSKYQRRNTKIDVKKGLPLSKIVETQKNERQLKIQRLYKSSQQNLADDTLQKRREAFKAIRKLGMLLRGEIPDAPQDDMIAEEDHQRESSTQRNEPQYGGQSSLSG